MLDKISNETTRPGINLLEPGIQLNPFPTYAMLREDHPVCQLEPDGRWALSRFDDVQFALTHHELFSSSALRALNEPVWIKDECKRDLFVLVEDPPLHTKHRALINKAFVAGLINKLTPLMRDAALQLVGQLRQHDNPELIKGFSYPYITQIMARLTGIDEQQPLEEFSQWIELTGAITIERPDKMYIAALETAITKQNRHFSHIIRDRQEKPRDDFITEIVHADIDGEKLSDQRLLNVIDLIIGAGFHAAINLLSLSVLQLSQRPEILTLLRTSPELIPDFIEEMLRYRSPVPSLIRKTLQAVTLHGVTIPADTLVTILVTAANHDPRYFPNPDHFDIHRKENKHHLSFGRGPHTCIGLALARLEVKIALETLLANVSQINCPKEEELNWYKTIMTHGVQALPLKFD